MNRVGVGSPGHTESRRCVGALRARRDARCEPPGLVLEAALRKALAAIAKEEEEDNGKLAELYKQKLCEHHQLKHV